MKTINSLVNRITKLAPNKITKIHVPQVLPLTAETTVSQKPSFFVGDFVRIVKQDNAFGKIYEQSFTDKVLEIKDIP